MIDKIIFNLEKDIPFSVIRYLEPEIEDIYNSSDNLYFCELSNLFKIESKEKIKLFFDILRTKDIIIIGGELYDFLNIINRIELDEADIIIDKILRLLTNRINPLSKNGISKIKPTIILFMTGVSANYLIKDIFDIYGHLITLIDIGQFFDLYLEKYENTI